MDPQPSKSVPPNGKNPSEVGISRTALVTASVLLLAGAGISFLSRSVPQSSSPSSPPVVKGIDSSSEIAQDIKFLTSKAVASVKQDMVRFLSHDVEGLVHHREHVRGLLEHPALDAKICGVYLTRAMGQEGVPLADDIVNVLRQAFQDLDKAEALSTRLSAVDTAVNSTLLQGPVEKLTEPRHDRFEELSVLAMAAVDTLAQMGLEGIPFLKDASKAASKYGYEDYCQTHISAIESGEPVKVLTSL